MILRHWKLTFKRVSSKSNTVPLGDVSLPIWIANTSDWSSYSATEHGTEYLTVLLCIMHVIEGWSCRLWKVLLPFLKNKKEMTDLFTKEVNGIKDGKKLLNGIRLACHC